MENSTLNEVKAILKSLVLSCPDKITIEQLNRDYRDIEGQFIPFRRLGYENIEEFLRSIPDTLRIFGSGPTAMVCFVGNEKSDHIHNMIMGQKKSKPKRTRSRSKGHANHAVNNKPQRSNKFNINTNQGSKTSGQQLSPFQSVNRNLTTKTTSVRDVQQLVQKPPLVKHLLYTLPQPSGIVLNTQQSLIYNNINSLQSIQHQAQKYDEHVMRVSTLLKQQCLISTPPPPPLPRHQIRTVKFSSEKNSSNTKKSANEKTSPEKPLTETKKVSPENQKTYTQNLSKTIKPPKATKQMPIKLSEEVESMLTIPKFIKVKNAVIESSTSDNYSEQLHNEEIPKLVKVTELSKTKLTKRFFDDSNDSVEDPDEAVPSYAAKNNVYRLDFPEHTVSYGRKIEPYKLSEDITVGSCIKIFISEVHNPFKFWFHIHKDDHELDQLMYQIERFYSSLDAEDLRIPMMCLTPGQICAALYNDLWHRAEIVSPPVNTSIKVSFMDYGTVTEVEIKNVKFLATHFALLPAQALRGCMSHIKPRSLHWCHDATIYFLTLVKELMLYAKIVEIDREKSISYMILCNTNGDEVIQINKSMIEKRYALYNEEWKTEKINQNNGKRIHHPREDFPTFSMIETGEYPSFIELVNLQHRGIDYEAIYDVILFNQSTILNKHENAPELIRNLPYFLTTSNPFRSDILLQLYASTSKAI